MPVWRGDDSAALDRCARLLADGGLVAFATETVYGLGARADDDSAVAAVFSAKGRPADHPLIVHLVDAASARPFAARLPPSALKLMSVFWPGPVTLVVQRRGGIATAAAGGRPTVGLRCPDHPSAQALLQRALALGVMGVAAPSANRFGRVSPTRAEHVVAEFGPELVVLDGGACREGIESTIIDCSRARPHLLRPGTTPRAAIEAVLGETLLERDADAPRVSGSLDSHYAPRAEVHLAPAHKLPSRVKAAALQLGPSAVGVYSRTVPEGLVPALHRAMPDNAAAVAHELFAVLRQFDADGVSQIWVEAPPESAEWDGVRDRLQRSATTRG